MAARNVDTTLLEDATRRGQFLLFIQWIKLIYEEAKGEKK